MSTSTTPFTCDVQFINDDDFINHYCINLNSVMAEVSKTPAVNKISKLLELSGVNFYPNTDNRLTKNTSVKLVSIGGLGIVNLHESGVTIGQMLSMSRQTMGCAGTMSYLGFIGDDSETTYNKIVSNYGHFSIAHTTSISILISGITCAVENEFNSQRDLIHLARITEARTNIQSCPPIVVKNEAMVDTYMNILKFIDSERSKLKSQVHEESTKDLMENLNLMYPASKATSVLITGSLRNIQKLLSSETDMGKEKEFRDVLTKMRDILSILWPELFLSK